jgi:hypothetical protein
VWIFVSAAVHRRGRCGDSALTRFRISPKGRFDSPVFRKIAVVFVLFIGFFYTMPQMKGAGTTLAYIFPGCRIGRAWCWWARSSRSTSRSAA